MIGKTLAHYEITGLLGKGGMGEVYRATDTRLNRAVAIKVLPQQDADDPTARARFEHEARALAALSHPHICTLHDVGYDEGARFLVMELVEGESLTTRLKKGPLPPEQVVQAGIQMADALDVAHRQNLIHRDIKPGNIMLTRSGVKLLDFGLALRSIERTSASFDEMDTRRQDLTVKGTVVGTPSYMAPEQLKGGKADSRSDMFALGAVLYLMATGHQAFGGDSPPEVMASILGSDPPPMDSLRDGIPPALARAIERCLAKDPEDRWQSARDLLLELRWIASAAAEPAHMPPNPRPMRMALGLAGLLAIALVVVITREGPPAPVARMARLSVVLPDEVSGVFAQVSPDGRHLAFTGPFEGRRRLWLRPLASLVARPLPRTEDAEFPFWSPDSRNIAFFTDGMLKTIAVEGGPPRTLCPAPGPFKLGSWSTDGTILFSLLEAPGQEGIHRVSETGGDLSTLTLRDAEGHDIPGVWPHFLPDGEHFLFLGLPTGSKTIDDLDLFAASTVSGRASRISDASIGESRVVYAQSGHILYARQGALQAQPFDVKSLRVQGNPETIAEQIEYYGPAGLANFSVSDNGVLVYQSEGTRAHLQWRDRNGRILGRVGEPANYTDISLNRDGTMLAASIVDPVTLSGDVWMIDLERNVSTRFTSGPMDHMGTSWLPDGRSVSFSVADGAPPFMHRRTPGGDTQVILPSTGTLQFAASWSPNGETLLYNDRDPDTGWDIWALPLDGKQQPRPFLRTEHAELMPMYSPDGSWVVFSSDESGQREVYVQSYEGRGEKQRVSPDGGSLALWNPDGTELFYLSLDHTLMVVPVAIGERFSAGTPTSLFRFEPGTEVIKPFAVSADGQRILVAAALPGQAQSPTVVLDWTAALADR